MTAEMTQRTVCKITEGTVMASRVPFSVVNAWFAAAKLQFALNVLLVCG